LDSWTPVEYTTSMECLESWEEFSELFLPQPLKSPSKMTTPPLLTLSRPSRMERELLENRVGFNSELLVSLSLFLSFLELCAVTSPLTVEPIRSLSLPMMTTGKLKTVLSTTSENTLPSPPRPNLNLSRSKNFPSSTMMLKILRPKERQRKRKPRKNRRERPERKKKLEKLLRPMTKKNDKMCERKLITSKSNKLLNINMKEKFYVRRTTPDASIFPLTCVRTNTG